MLTIAPDLQTHLDSGATTLCHCWQFSRRDGVSLGFTDHDRPLAFENTEFMPDSGLTGSALSATADLAVDNSEVMGLLNSPLLREEDLVAGRYDDALIRIWRVNWANPDQRMVIRTGSIGEITRFENGFRAEIRGASHFLDQTVGRLYQRQCDANVGDKRCGVDLDTADFKTSGTVIEVVADNALLVDGLDGFDGDWFAQGLLTWETGANAGISSFVKTNGAVPGAGNDGHSLALWQPFPLPPAPGDTFTITAGCDRRFETCVHKFSNAINFRGFHLMPGNDFIIQIPTRDGNNDGGRR